MLYRILLILIIVKLILKIYRLIILCLHFWIYFKIYILSLIILRIINWKKILVSFIEVELWHLLLILKLLLIEFIIIPDYLNFKYWLALKEQKNNWEVVLLIWLFQIHSFKLVYKKNIIVFWSNSMRQLLFKLWLRFIKNYISV